MINEIQKNEFVAAESLLLDRLSDINPLVKTFVMQSPKAQAVINSAEDAILLCMNENGLVNGKLLGGMLQDKFPGVCGWINVPQGEFRLADEIGKILNILVGN